MQYRREIDGLRALAVLPVILFHAGIQIFSGGFVGVDVFFVISGYLITSIIIEDLEAGKFSIAEFYERRARRILPALFVVMAVCIPFVLTWMLPSDTKDFSKSLIAVTVFSSNLLFWRESGYFAPTAELKPLLHTWSLAVEEQFYVIFPILLMLSWKSGIRRVSIILASILVLSLALAQWAVQEKPTAAFYLLPTRAWELLLGSLVALYLHRNSDKENNDKLSEVAALLGLGLVLLAVFAYSKATPFPSIYTLVPAIGTALIILFAKPQTVVGKALGSKTLVGIGLVSYSAYLWHQPLFAFARHRSLLEPSPVLLLFLGVLSLCLAYFTWRFVEAPFRDKNNFSRSRIFVLAVIGSTIFFCLGTYGYFKEGVIGEKDAAKAVLLDSRMTPNLGLSADCEGVYNDSPNCSTSAQPEVLLWGDSYAMHLADGIVSSKPAVGLVQKTVSVCGPVLGIAPINETYKRPWAERCLATNDKVFDFLQSTPSIKYVVLSTPFSSFMHKDSLVLNRAGNVVSGQEVALDHMKDTLHKIRALGKTPVVFSPPPRNGSNFGQCLKKASFFSHALSSCNFSRTSFLEDQSDVRSFLKSIEGYATVVWLDEFLCKEDECYSSIGNIFVYRDDGHLSREGSTYLGTKMKFYDLLVKAAGDEPANNQ